MDYSGIQESYHNILLDLGEICEDWKVTEMGYDHVQGWSAVLVMLNLRDM
jgi:hypothetical protein